MKHKLVWGAIIIVIAAGVVYSVIHTTKKTVSPSIPVGSTLAAAKSHAKGSLPACLSNAAASEAAVRADDKLINGKWSAFDLAAASGIIDVPAGTTFDTRIHSYANKSVTGSIVYQKNYGTYNYTIVPSSSSKPYAQWTMTSLTACK